MPSQTEITYDTPQYPRQLRLDSTCKCNARCLSCHRFLSKRKGEMSTELITQLLTDVSRWEKPLTEIVPVNYGELFLRDDWVEILGTITRILPYTQIVLPTNGSFMDDETVDKICKIPTVRIINFSINAYFDETYEAFTGLKAENLPKMRRAMTRFKILRSDIQLVASMVFDPTYQTDYERDWFRAYWQSHAEVWIAPAASAGRNKIAYPVKIPCRSLFSDIVVGYDGKISSCCFDADFSLNLGYYNGGLLDNWHGKELSKLRGLHNKHRRDEIELCKNCSFG